LERTGYTVTETIDGEDTIRQFLQNKDTINFLIIDAVMPEKNGKEVHK
jgi:DNA-binding response OmpR family regulator